MRHKILSLTSILAMTIGVCVGQTAQQLASKAAESFSKQYCKNYACKATLAKTISQNGKYVQLNAIQMIFGAYDFNQSTENSYFLDDGNTFYYAPLTIMRSDAFADGQVINYHNNSSENDEKLEINYAADPGDSKAFLLKRAIEVYGPLNPLMVQYIDYKIEKTSTNGAGNEIVEMSFQTMPKSFPEKTRVLACGKMYYNKTKNYVEKVTVSDIVDFFTSFIRKAKYDGYSATPIQMQIQYTMQANFIFTRSISYSMQWRELKRGYYYAMTNARPNPVATKLSQYEYIQFSDFKVDYSKKIYPMLKNTTMGQTMTDYYSPYIASKWANVNLGDIKLNKVRADLTVGSNTFDAQVSRNGMKPTYLDVKTGKPIKESAPLGDLKFYTEKVKEFCKTTTSTSYPAIFGKPF